MGCPTGFRYGGTSLAAPVWAAFTALLNDAEAESFDTRDLVDPKELLDERR